MEDKLKHKILFALVMLIFPAFVWGQSVRDVTPMMFTGYDNTTSMNSTDTSQTFTTAFSSAHNTQHGTTISAAQWAKVKAVWITCENNDVRLSFGTPAVQGTSTTGVGHVLASGGSVRIVDPKKISQMRFISKTSGSAGRLQVSLEY